ncbi:hypothetical protein KJ605_00330, partial [Patescibacteria group bacterium]|nr:hypothetical protein [Patescibacteria group bacterium]
QGVKSLPIFSYVLNVLTALFGLFVNAWLVYQITHDSFALITARMPWWGGAQSFIGGFITYLMQISPYKLLEILFFVVALGVLISFYYLKSFENKLLNELSLSCAIMFGLIGLLGGGLTGITKYYAIGFPVFFYLARLSERSSKSVKTLALLGFLMGLLFMVCWTISSRLVV